MCQSLSVLPFEFGKPGRLIQDNFHPNSFDRYNVIFQTIRIRSVSWTRILRADFF